MPRHPHPNPHSQGQARPGVWWVGSPPHHGSCPTESHLMWAGFKKVLSWFPPVPLDVSGPPPHQVGYFGGPIVGAEGGPRPCCPLAIRPTEALPRHWPQKTGGRQSLGSGGGGSLGLLVLPPTQPLEDCTKPSPQLLAQPIHPPPLLP